MNRVNRLQRYGLVGLLLTAIVFPVDSAAARRARQQNDPTTAQADPRIATEHKGRFFSRSGVKGCLTGALGGALLGRGVGSSRHGGRDLAIGALAGCAAGMSVNYYMDNKRAQYANVEDRLDAIITEVREDNQELQSLNTAALEVIADDRRTLEQLRTDIAQGQLQTEQARRQLARIDANRAALETRLAEQRATRDEWLKVAEQERGSGDRARLDIINAEINKMTKVENELQMQMDAVYRQRSAIRLGVG